MVVSQYDNQEEKYLQDFGNLRFEMFMSAILECLVNNNIAQKLLSITLKKKKMIHSSVKTFFFKTNNQKKGCYQRLVGSKFMKSRKKE